MSEPHLRMSDAEREQAAGELGEHFAQGRLTAEEHSERLDQIWAARTRGELAPIFRDLPGRFGQPLVAPASAPRARDQRMGVPWRHGLPVPFVAVLAVLVVFTVVTHLPVILLGLLAWFLLSSRHRHGGFSRRW
jgi:hypothetical protein